MTLSKPEIIIIDIRVHLQLVLISWYSTNKSRILIILWFSASYSRLVSQIRAILAVSREPAGKLWQLSKVLYAFEQ